MKRVRWIVPAVLVTAAVLAFLGNSSAAEPPRKGGPDPKQWHDVVDRAIEYLRRTQNPDGSWGQARPQGVTGVVVTGLLQSGKVTSKDPMVERGLKYIEGLINRKAGHIAGP
jgi:squalene-hopene/tetraprenyl-beta-curcumene cyclase